MDKADIPAEKFQNSHKSLNCQTESDVAGESRVFAPINIAAAINLLSDNASAGALANQYASGQQGI